MSNKRSMLSGMNVKRSVDVSGVKIRVVAPEVVKRDNLRSKSAAAGPRYNGGSRYAHSLKSS